MFDRAPVPGEKVSLHHQIAALGFRVPALTGAGLSLAVAVADVNEGGPAAASYLGMLERTLAAGAAVCLMPALAGGESAAIAAWQQFCEATRRFLCERSLASARLAVCMPSHPLPPEAWCLVADAVLGRGPRYLFLDSPQFGASTQGWLREKVESVWQFLWAQARRARPVLPVYGGVVRSACPLLSDEVALGLLPVGGLLAPYGSAWLPIDLSLCRFADRKGRLDEERLHRSLEDMLPLADRLIDATDWPCRELAADARRNRRVALMVRGFGDLAALAGENPADLACLERLSGIAGRIRRKLRDRSAALAASAGPLPALGPADLTAGWRAGPGRELWQNAWREALQKSAVRHRNLVVMAPASVLPAQADARYADLLPVIAHADAWHFAWPACFADGGPAAFRAFHRRARATIQGTTANSFVAAGV